MFCCRLLYVHSCFAIILMGKKELVAFLSLSSWCLVMVVRLFLAVPWVCLRFVIVVFPDLTHYFCPVLSRFVTKTILDSLQRATRSALHSLSTNSSLFLG